MDDIARECGVSKMTVSRVLAGRQGASPAMREKVLSVAKALNYENNILASNFAQRRSGFVGVATPFEGLIGSSYLAAVFKGFQRVLSDSAWDFALFDILSSSFSDGSKLEKLYRSRKVEGLLVVAPALTGDHFLATLTDLEIRLVVVGEMVAPSNVSCVVCDDAQGIDLACEHLYSLGHRRIGFVSGPQNLTTSRRRQSAYLEFCRRRGLRTPREFIEAGIYTMESGRIAGLKLLGLKYRPTGIVAANDMMAFGLFKAARELKLDVPLDLSIVGFDNLVSDFEDYSTITTIHQPVAEIAAQAAQLLLHSIETGQKPDRKVVLPVHLVQRTSTAPPRG